MGDIFDAIQEDYGCRGCGEIISPLVWKNSKLVDGNRYHPGCEPKPPKEEKGYTSKGIRELADYSYGSGNFHSLVFEILADMMEKLEKLEYRQKWGHDKPE